MKSNVHEPYGEVARQQSCAWLDDVAPILSSAALTFLGLLLEIVLAKQLGIAPRSRTMLVFVTGMSVLPVVTMTLQDWLDRRSPEAGRLLEAANVWCAVAALASLALVAIVGWAGKGGMEFWRKAALHVAEVSTVGYIVLITWLRFAVRTEGFLDRAGAIIARWSSRPTQTLALAFAFAAAVITLFRIEPENRYFTPVLSFLFPTAPGGFPDLPSLLLATLTAALLVAGGAGFLILERRLAVDHPARLQSAQRAALAVALVASVVLSFDFSLAADAFHYMTVIGPALHLLHGGTLMVDTFSQYGPGPVLATYLAFRLGPPSFAVANLAIQLCNLTFYGLFLIALWQSTRTRITAVWFGLIFILFWLSSWDNGQGNVNAAPSVLGARYLPILLMAVALGARRGSRHSALTLFAGFLSSLWSIEAFVGSAALYAGSLTPINLRDLNYTRLMRDFAIAALPMIAGLAVLSIGTLAAAGSWPAFNIYLGFLSSYNPLSQFWSVPFDAAFWGWMPIMAAVTITIAGCWRLTIDGRSASRQILNDTWLQHALPAAILTALTGAYYAGRSVDFTVAIALLPFGLLFVPAALWLAGRALGGDRVAVRLTAVTVATVFWASIFCCLYVLRVDSPYTLLLQECRDHDRCSPAALARSLSETVNRELALNSRNSLWSLDDYDRTIVADAKGLIERFSGKATKVTVLLGESSDGWQMLSDIALMYTDKWHTWPRSFTFSDELVPALFKRILAEDVTLASGDLVLVRRDVAGLGQLERAILERLRTQGALCELRGSTPDVAAYRIRKTGDPQAADDCREQTMDLAEEIVERSRGRTADLAALIDGIRAVSRALPDGALNYPALERAGATVPPNLVAGRRLVSFSGTMSLQKSGSQLTIDLFALPQAACRQLLPPISQLAGVERLAVTGTLADEKSVPISQAQAELLCAQNTRQLRIIANLKERSSSE
ncbi:hypothetical protein [Bradyrhizobium commune]|uniref:Uncharacterized protein n=1 Tax=Bradyrhizobium commune TaxID=83627 RepID=A0A7S9D9W4_9BRAD|nr:hypothetical protein [Bradyrhizobium commune]QPF93894.1 hypothetical protein IC761_11765 [Bradyrhizobium commune]